MGGSDRISRTSARDLMDSINENRIKVRGDDDLTQLHVKRDASLRNKRHQKSARRNSIMKSLAVLDIGDNDDFMLGKQPDYNSEGESSCGSDASARRRYLRRGSVTKHKLQAEVGGMQPNSISVRLDRPGDSGSDDYGSGYDSSASERRRRYLRRGSVTKYSLDAHVGEMQPTNVMQDGRNRPRKVLPPPPKPNSGRALGASDIPESTEPPTQPSKSNSTADAGHTMKTTVSTSKSKSKRSVSSRKSKNLDDSGHRRTSANADDSGHRRSLKKSNLEDSGLRRSLKKKSNLDDSGHRRSLKKSNLDDSGHRRSLKKSNLDDSGHRRSAKKAGIGSKDPRGGPRRDPSVASISSSCDDSDDEFAAVPASSLKKPPPITINGIIENLTPTPLKRRISRQRAAPEPVNPTPVGPKIKGILKREGRRNRQSNNVTFGDLVITEFPIILGDNPAVTMGAPVTIDWKPQGEISYKLDVYETVRGTRRRRRKLLISVSNRAILLLAAGYTIDDIADASIDAQQIKFGRQESMQNQGWDGVNMMMETTGDAVGAIGNMMAVGAIGNMMEGAGKKIRAIVKPMRNSEMARTA